METKQLRKYQQVAAGATVDTDLVIPNGVKILGVKLATCGPGLSTAGGALIWDATGSPTVVAAWYHDSVVPIEQVVVGNGSKVLRLRLINQHTAPVYLGASLFYEQT